MISLVAWLELVQPFFLFFVSDVYPKPTQCISECVMQVDRLGPDAETRQLLAQSGIRLPCIVKPRVACGMPEAHQMAVVLHEDGFRDLEVHLCLLHSTALDKS